MSEHSSIDQALAGLKPEPLLLIGARPKVGKIGLGSLLTAALPADIAERVALARRICLECLEWEIMDPLTGDWWTPSLRMSDVLRINPAVRLRTKGGAS